MKAFNQKLSDEFSKGNLEFAFPHFAEDIQWKIIGGTVIQGKGAVEAHCRKMLVEMAASILINTSHIVDDESAATQGYCDYVYEGKPGRVEYCDIYKFSGQKLQEIISYCIEIKH